MNSSRVAICIPSFGSGGVERMMVNIARGLAAAGTTVDFVTLIADGPYLNALPATVGRVTLPATDLRHGLVDYLRLTRPGALLTAKVKDDVLALEAKQLAGVGTRVFTRVGTTFSAHRGTHKIKWIKHWWRARMLRQLYRQVDGIICVSAGVADDLQAITGLSRTRMHVVPNPVVTPELIDQAAEVLSHPWFAAGEPPVILGAGRLSSAKNFALLLRAFARLREERSCRVMIIGEGHKRGELQTEARRLGIDDHFALPGFVHNAYAYMAKAALFVLSSNVEGSPNVLTEALACGTPVVATDCRSGPREILADGRYGRERPDAARRRTSRDTTVRP
jgi:glycosyltransferase involved in cell wall biosynthesis